MTIDQTMNYHYSKLGQTQKKAYEAILPAIERGEKSIELKVPKLTKDMMQLIITSMVNDWPEYFWFEGQGTYFSSNDLVTKFEPVYNDLYKNRAACQKSIAQKVAAITGPVRKAKETEQEKYCHDWLVKNIHYVEADHCRDVYGALVKGKAVCAGYAKAMQLLMRSLDIPCYYCSGVARNSKGKTESHAWNLIMLGGKYYNVDVTWDDGYDKQPQELINYHYYNVTDTEILADHQRDDISKQLPKCNATAMAFEYLYNHNWQIDLILQMGVTRRKIINNKQGLYDIMTLALKGKGKGKYTESFAVRGKEVAAQMSDVMRQLHGDLKLTRYSMSWETSYSEVAPGYLWFEIKVTIS